MITAWRVTLFACHDENSSEKRGCFCVQCSGLYLSHTLNAASIVTGSYFGVMDPTSGNTNTLTYSYGTSMVAGTVLTGVQVTSNSTALTINSATGDYQFNYTFSDRQNSSFLEGVWTAFDGDDDCILTVQFTGSLFRSYRLGPKCTENHAYTGVVK